MNWTRLFVGALLSVLIIPAVWVVAGTYWGVSFGEIYSGLVFVYLPVSLVVAMLFGTPMFLLYQAFRIKSLCPYMLGGAAIALLTAIPIGRWFGSYSMQRGGLLVLDDSLGSVGLGILAGLSQAQSR